MIARVWRGRTPLGQAHGFHRHLIKTGVADYRRVAGCLDVHLWRRDHDGTATFTLLSIWRDMASIRRYAGPDAARAILYPGDERFGLVPDLEVEHHQLLSVAP